MIVTALNYSKYGTNSNYNYFSKNLGLGPQPLFFPNTILSYIFYAGSN